MPETGDYIKNPLFKCNEQMGHVGSGIIEDRILTQGSKTHKNAFCVPLSPQARIVRHASISSISLGPSVNHVQFNLEMSAFTDI